MATPSTPLTPSSGPGNIVVSSDPAGTWTHPRMSEVNRRLKASSVGDGNVRSVVLNLLAIFATILLPRVLSVLPYPFSHLLQATAPWSRYAVLACRALSLVFIGIALYPLSRPKDDLSDIPLTPQQRKLLGLPPTSRPATPGSTYITPPRYSRSATPRSDVSSPSGSPYSGSNRGSPLGTTAYSPSPLLQKAMNRDVSRRHSLGAASGSPQQALTSLRFGSDAFKGTTNTTTSPKAGRSSGVNLTSRWLYEKGRASSASRQLFA